VRFEGTKQERDDHQRKQASAASDSGDGSEASPPVDQAAEP
jgi:hypothetical protein